MSAKLRGSIVSVRKEDLVTKEEHSLLQRVAEDRLSEIEELKTQLTKFQTSYESECQKYTRTSDVLDKLESEHSKLKKVNKELTEKVAILKEKDDEWKDQVEVLKEEYEKIKL